MKVELRTAKVLTAERVEKSKKLLKLSVDVGTRAANAGGRHRRSLRAGGAGRQDGRHRLQSQAGEADGHRVERDGAGREPRRRQADGRLLRDSAGARHASAMIAKRWRAAVAALALSAMAVAAAPPPTTTTRNEAATARYFASVRKNPSLLLAFLTQMPKGGDLHNHLSGAVYAESFLRWAAEDHLCFATATLSIIAGPCDASAGRPPASAAVDNGALFNQVDRCDVDAALGSVAQRPRSFLRHLRQIRSVVGEDWRHARRAGDARGSGACQLSRADADAGRRNRCCTRPRRRVGPGCHQAARQAPCRRLSRRGGERRERPTRSGGSAATRADEVRTAAGRCGLSCDRALRLPGCAGQRPRIGVRANARRVRDRDRRPARRQLEPCPAGGRPDGGA